MASVQVCVCSQTGALRGSGHRGLGHREQSAPWGEEGPAGAWLPPANSHSHVDLCSSSSASAWMFSQVN